MIKRYTIENTVHSGLRAEIRINGKEARDILEAWVIGPIVIAWGAKRDSSGRMVLTLDRSEIARRLYFGLGRVELLPL